ARPGGNITGLAHVVGLEVFGKRIQLLKEILPNMERLALLIPPGFPFEVRTHIETTSQQLGLKLVRAEHGYLTHPGGVPVWEQRDYKRAFALIRSGRSDALYVPGGSTNYNARGLIVESAAQDRLPAIYFSRDFVDAGGLMSYGTNIPDLFRRAAGYVD